jgi:hypothetical protein
VLYSFESSAQPIWAFSFLIKASDSISSRLLFHFTSLHHSPLLSHQALSFCWSWALLWWDIFICLKPSSFCTSLSPLIKSQKTCTFWCRFVHKVERLHQMEKHDKWIYNRS